VAACMHFYSTSSQVSELPACQASTCWHKTCSQSLLFTCTVCVSLRYIAEAATWSARCSMTCCCTDFHITCIACTQHQAVVIIEDEKSAENSNITQRRLRNMMEQPHQRVQAVRAFRCRGPSTYGRTKDCYQPSVSICQMCLKHLLLWQPDFSRSELSQYRCLWLNLAPVVTLQPL